MKIHDMKRSEAEKKAGQARWSQPFDPGTNDFPHALHMRLAEPELALRAVAGRALLELALLVLALLVLALLVLALLAPALAVREAALRVERDADALPGVRAERSLSKSLSACLLVFDASRRSAVSAVVTSL